MNALRRPLVPILLGLIVLLLAVLVGLLWRNAPPRPVEPVLLQQPAAISPLPTAAPASPPAAGVEPLLAPAPWDQSGNPLLDAPVPPGSVLGSRTELLEKQRQLTELQVRLQRMTAGGRQPQPAEVAAALRDLQAMQGPVVGGVDLRTLQKNLEVADRMQQIAAEMQQITATGGPDEAARAQQKLAELQQLQEQLVTDFGGATPAPAEPAR